MFLSPLENVGDDGTGGAGGYANVTDVDSKNLAVFITNLDNEVSFIGCMSQYHWIVYEGDLNINTIKNEFTFSYWCWNKLNIKTIFRKNVFNTNFYGYLKYK